LLVSSIRIQPANHIILTLFYLTVKMIAKFVGTTNTVSEVVKRTLGQKLTREFEQKVFGKSLDEYDLSGKAWWAYIYGIGAMVQNGKWENMDDDRQKSLIMDLRNWIIKNEQNPNLLEDTDIRWRNEIEEVQQ